MSIGGLYRYDAYVFFCKRGYYHDGRETTHCLTTKMHAIDTGAVTLTGLIVFACDSHQTSNFVVRESMTSNYI